MFRHAEKNALWRSVGACPCALADAEVPAALHLRGQLFETRAVAEVEL